ncbi:MAG: citramalate synthase [Spirochaetes bacterium]|nr:MAG: citramalate synthase [Spirochaetota bacterium]
MKKIYIYDTTLRDGSQSEDISFSLDDKLRIAEKLNEMGIHYIEGGWPGSNPKDIAFFKEVKKLNLKNSRIVAFGSTCRADTTPDKDANIQALLDADTKFVTVVGKSWHIHPLVAMGISLEDNIRIIKESIQYLKKKGLTVFFDAEHLFDGFIENPSYCMETLHAAVEGGADWIVLCDTNGGALPFDIERIIKKIKREIKKPLGIHAHNDSETAVANSLISVKLGIRMVQGTINGYGERCGNANLCSLIPALKFKMKMPSIPEENIKKLKEVSRFVDELANLSPDKHQPYVGDSAFAHKGGIHVSAIRREPRSYEHIPPESVGNRRRILISDLSGQSNVLSKAEEFNIKIDPSGKIAKKILKELKELENKGYQFEAAEGSFEILIKKELGLHKNFFELIGFKVIVDKNKDSEASKAEATIMVKVKDKIEHTAALGNGPVNALDNALRKALEKFYPQLKEVTLTDYKVRVLGTSDGTGAVTRVLIESRDNQTRWGTIGVSENIIEASWQALVDSIDYKLLKEEEKGNL